MRKLIEGILDFKKKLSSENQKSFANLAFEQKPDALFIACSDSRVVPNLFASTDPGDLFVLRNIGNIIPPVSLSSSEAPCCSPDLCTSAFLEFSINSLNISDIIVCGHSECGAMEALSKGLEVLSCSHLKSWLKYGETSLRLVREGFILDPSLSEPNQISQVNVLEQMKHITTYPFVQDLLAKKKLRIHGWWFDIAKADVYSYEEDQNRFILIDEKEAMLILKRLG